MRTAWYRQKEGADKPLSRRIFIQKAAAVSAVSVISGYLGPASGVEAGTISRNSARRNVLFIAVDDLRPCFGTYGGPALAPNLDRLASESRIFNRHYVQSAVCGPSRCSLLTGRRINSWDCWKALRLTSEPSNPASFAHVFRRNGYRTVCIGKISHQPGGVMDKEQKIHQVPFSWDLSYAPVGPWKTPWRAFFSYDNAKAYNKVIRMEKDEPRLPYESADVPDTGYADGWNAREAVRQLRNLKARGEPFLLAVGFYKPHLPFNAPNRYWDLYKREQISLAKNSQPPNGVDPAISLHNSFEVTTHYDWPSGPGQISKQEARTLRHGYFACVSYVDAQIGKVLDELKRLQLDRNTVVVLWSDHGWHLGEHGMFGKQTNFEIATRSPLFIKVPGMAQPGVKTHSLVETVDLYPTLADLCGLKKPNDLAGVSLKPILDDPQQSGKEFAFSFHPRGQLMGRAVRTDRYRLVYWTDKTGKAVQVELYDHQNDPEENVNVAGDHSEIVQKRVQQLKQRSIE